MRLCTAILCLIISQNLFAITDWAQPPGACIEDVVPNIPSEPCLDLSMVADATKDFPPEFTEEDIALWKSKRKTLQYCRYEEVLRREAAAPGSQKASTVELAWMLISAIEGRDEKIAAIYQGSRDNKMPAQVLAGALRQESLFANLGISPDGDNYSCGAGQVNLVEWCHWATKTSDELKAQLKWPKYLKCDQLRSTYVKPLYEIAITKLNGLVPYKMGAEHFQDIKYQDVAYQFPVSSERLRQARLQAAMSFTQHCIEPKYGIAAKAYEVSLLYRDFIPKAMKDSQNYPPNEKWQKVCRDTGYEGSYPFHIGWVFAVGMYNAGPSISNVLTHYWGWDKAAWQNPATYANITPLELIEGMYWGGKWDGLKDQLVYTKLDGKEGRSGWYKMCIVQRHIARVVQDATQEGVPPLVDTLEGSYGCKPTKYDEFGNVVTSAPPARQVSTGKK